MRDNVNGSDGRSRLNDGDDGFVQAGVADLKDGFEIRTLVTHIGKGSSENQREYEDAAKIFQQTLVPHGVRYTGDLT